MQTYKQVIRQIYIARCFILNPTYGSWWRPGEFGYKSMTFTLSVTEGLNLSIFSSDCRSYVCCFTVVIKTLNMLNCFKDYKRYIHILNHISNLAWPKWMKLSLEQHYMLYVLHSQYHACWCTGNFRSQCISRHYIDLQSRNIPSPASEELRWVWNWLCQSGTQIFCYRQYLYTISCLMDLQYPEKYFCLWHNILKSIFAYGRTCDIIMMIWFLLWTLPY